MMGLVTTGAIFVYLGVLIALFVDLERSRKESERRTEELNAEMRRIRERLYDHGL